MNRPTRNTLFGLVLCLILAGYYSCTVMADPRLPNALPLSMQTAFNNFSHEAQTCQVYNLVASACFAEKDAALKDRISKSADAFGELAFNSAKLVGLSQKALMARTHILTKQMMDDLDNNCINISVLLDKYAAQCKSFMDHSADRIDSILKGGN